MTNRFVWKPSDLVVEDGENPEPFIPDHWTIEEVDGEEGQDPEASDE